MESSYSKRIDFKDKRVLITQNDISSINGSSVIVLELANFFKEKGASVVVYTYYLDNPLKEIFQSVGIDVITDDDTLHLRQFEYIWVQHQVLPLSLIKELDTLRSLLDPPVFIFNHMSALPEIADEFPYVWDLENKLSSLSLYNAPYTMNEQKGLINRQVPKELYQNLAPDSFLRSNKLSSTKVRHILVVSNHPPQEIVELKNEFIRDGVYVTILGEGQDKYKLFDVDTLRDYDVVITIGKTVQNCLVAGVVVYVYDHFGGPGYLDIDNLKMAEYNNYSGRGFSKKTSKQIHDEILENYEAALKYTHENKSLFIDTYSISHRLPTLISVAEKRRYKKFTDIYIKYLVHSHTYSRIHRAASRERFNYKNEVALLREKINTTNAELNAVKNSKAYRLGSSIAYVFRRIKIWARRRY